MESLQRLAALPLVDNACASRANRDSWSYSVYCREVRPAEAEDPDAMLRGHGEGLKSVNNSKLLEGLRCSKVMRIASFMWNTVNHQNLSAFRTLYDGTNHLDDFGIVPPPPPTISGNLHER